MVLVIAHVMLINQADFALPGRKALTDTGYQGIWKIHKNHLCRAFNNIWNFKKLKAIETDNKKPLILKSVTLMAFNEDKGCIANYNAYVGLGT